LKISLAISTYSYALLIIYGIKAWIGILGVENRENITKCKTEKKGRKEKLIIFSFS